MNSVKWLAISNAVIQTAGCACVLGATYITKNPICLWGLILVPCMGIGYTSGRGKEKQES